MRCRAFVFVAVSGFAVKTEMRLLSAAQHYYYITKC